MTRTKVTACCSCALAMLLACQVAGLSTASAQQRLGGPTAASPSNIAAKPAMPTPETLLALVRTHVLALDHALRTGNFYVLHALSGPFLQSRLTPEQLSQTFKSLKTDRPDLVAAAITTPSLAVAPAFAKNGMLWLKGTFPTSPKQIRFEMMFEVTAQEWRLAGLDIGTAIADVGGAKKPPSPPGNTAKQ